MTFVAGSTNLGGAKQILVLGTVPITRSTFFNGGDFAAALAGLGSVSENLLSLAERNMALSELSPELALKDAARLYSVAHSTSAVLTYSLGNGCFASVGSKTPFGIGLNGKSFAVGSLWTNPESTKAIANLRKGLKTGLLITEVEKFVTAGGCLLPIVSAVYVFGPTVKVVSFAESEEKLFKLLRKNGDGTPEKAATCRERCQGAFEKVFLQQGEEATRDGLDYYLGLLTNFPDLRDCYIYAAIAALDIGDEETAKRLLDRGEKAFRPIIPIIKVLEDISLPGRNLRRKLKENTGDAIHLLKAS